MAGGNMAINSAMIYVEAERAMRCHCNSQIHIHTFFNSPYDMEFSLKLTALVHKIMWKYCSNSDPQFQLMTSAVLYGNVLYG